MMYTIFMTLWIILSVYFWWRALKSTLQIIVEIERYFSMFRYNPNAPILYWETVRYALITWGGLALLFIVMFAI